MMKNNMPRLFLVILIALIMVSVMSAVAAGIVVPPTRLDDQSFAITIGDFTPADCSSMSLNNVVTGSGLIFGTAGNDLILGGGTGDLIFSLGGGDCLVGGGGDDFMFGGGGTDVCIGGPGNDSFNQCETQVP